MRGAALPACLMSLMASYLTHLGQCTHTVVGCKCCSRYVFPHRTLLPRTGLNSTSLAMPCWPMMEIAWSMPPDSVPTYFSQDAVNVATSCAAANPTQSLELYRC